MSRARKRGVSASNEPSNDSQSGDLAENGEACMVCFERFAARRRTVHDGSVQRVRVAPFQCAHEICSVCDDSLKRRGDGRCPCCRRDRREPLQNDMRQQPSANEVHVLTWDALMQIEMNHNNHNNNAQQPTNPLNTVMAMATSLAHQRFMQMQRQSDAQQLEGGADAGNFEEAPSQRHNERPRRSSNNFRVFTQLRPADSALVDRLVDPTSTNLTQFRSLLNMMPQPQNGTAAFRIVRVRPHNP